MQAKLKQDSDSGRIELLTKKVFDDLNSIYEVDEAGGDNKEDQGVHYISTSLVSGRNLNVSNIQLQSRSQVDIKQDVLKHFDVENKLGLRNLIIDPRIGSRQRYKQHSVLSSIAFAKIAELAEKAAALMGDRRQIQAEQIKNYLSKLKVKPELATINQEFEQASRNPYHNYYQVPNSMATFSKRIIKKKLATQKANEKAIWMKRKVADLRQDSGLSIKQISKRVRITTYHVRKILVEQGLVHQPKGLLPLRMKKPPALHQRARAIICSYLADSKSLVQAPELVRLLKDTHGIRVSRPTIVRFLKSQLGLAYKRASPIHPMQNSQDCLLQRQYAASKYIELLGAKKNIINIDESVIRATDNRQRGWLPSGAQRFLSKSQRLYSINIIAAVSSSGELWFTINKGMTNSATFLLFLKKLLQHFDSKCPAWRRDTVLMLDNASYHRSGQVLDSLRMAQVEVLFLGPYHFKMAPVERFFSFIKCRDLNLLNTRTQNRQDLISFKYQNQHSH